MIGDKIATILDDHSQAVPKWADILSKIMEDLRRLEAGLEDMKLDCVRLEAAGMWPAVPTEMWEERNGSEARYLRLYFPRGTLGVREKTYIGCKPSAIADARRKMANRIRWEGLDGEICDLERVLRGVEAALDRQRMVVSMRPLPDLGTTAGSGSGLSVPKEEGKG